MVALLCVLQQQFRLKSKSNWHGLRCNAISIHWLDSSKWMCIANAALELFKCSFYSFSFDFLKNCITNRVAIEIKMSRYWIYMQNEAYKLYFIQHNNINLLHFKPHIIIRFGIDVHHIWRIKNWTDKLSNDISQHANINELPTLEIEDTLIKILILDVRNPFLMSIATAHTYCHK